MIRQFASYYAPHKLLFTIDFGCAIVVGLLELGFPLAVKLFVDHLLPAQNWPLILLAGAGLLFIYLLNTALTAVVVYWGHMLGINIETTMRRKAFEHLQKLSFRFYDNNKTGHLITRVTKDLEEIGEVAHHGPEDVFIAVMTFIGAIALMAFISVPLTLFTIIFIPIVLLVVSRYGGRMTTNWQSLYRRVGDFNVRVEENVGGMRLVQAFANEHHERDLFAKDNAQYRKTKLEAYKLMAASTSLNYMSMRLIQLVIMLAGSYFVLNGSLSYGGFVGFLLLLTVFFRPVEKINAVIETYPKGIAGFRRYLDLLATEPDIKDAADAVPAPPLAGRIRFDNVGFDYGGDRPVLKGINLDIAAGETVALIGQSGAGKTTICSLLPRFYDVTSGRISIDGIDLRDMTLASLRGQIGIVQQDVFLFGGTLRENIAYGRLGASDAEIMDAIRHARLEGVVADLPEGLDTIIGERGMKLSGGQKQRVAISRIFLKDPPILILDEATSALDTQTEHEIQTALEDLSEQRTTLIIAHRLATIRKADKVAVVSDGEIVEYGTNAELLSRDSRYRQMTQVQSM
ncbi:ABC transporter ATP-binding protein [Rhodobacterales bacterium]|nr:ABC transporter ATP-binding protein [Rhodobacterales bacterium]